MLRLEIHSIYPIQGRGVRFRKCHHTQPAHAAVIQKNQAPQVSQEMECTPSPHEEKIIALESSLKKISSYKKGQGNMAKNTPKMEKQGSERNTKGFQRPECKLSKPTDITNPKTFESKEYWWCEAKHIWARHTPYEYRAKEKKNIMRVKDSATRLEKAESLFKWKRIEMNDYIMNIVIHMQTTKKNAGYGLTLIHQHILSSWIKSCATRPILWATP